MEPLCLGNTPEGVLGEQAAHGTLVAVFQETWCQEVFFHVDLSSALPQVSGCIKHPADVPQAALGTALFDLKVDFV